MEEREASIVFTGYFVVLLQTRGGGKWRSWDEGERVSIDDGSFSLAGIAVHALLLPRGTSGKLHALVYGPGAEYLNHWQHLGSCLALPVWPYREMLALVYIHEPIGSGLLTSHSFGSFLCLVCHNL